MESGLTGDVCVAAVYFPGTWQIGLTGKTITPELYITVGISGASQHGWLRGSQSPRGH